MKETAIRAAKEAGQIQLSYFCKDLKKSIKKDGSYVTEVDLKCIKSIRKIILDQFPNHSILDEEMGFLKKSPDYKWIIDPLDGTHNFMMDNPLFGVSIALEHKKKIVLGVIYMPVLNRLYYGELGKGAFCNGRRLKVNNNDNIRKSLFMYDVKLKADTDWKVKMLKNISKHTWHLRMHGAAVYNLVTVAEGKADFALDFDSNSWDHSAGFLMIEEAGGKVTDLNGKKWTPYIKGYVASNGKIHEKVLKVLNNR